mmetsp:Transcript_23286/g.30814  ORF Transcript_23286/g.30814 Transcript_23286/m.30814 type:complete len:85 (-) Transcript_23286:7-261(-)|eukprot:288865-Ditylum_brightwellii.AAC.1
MELSKCGHSRAPRGPSSSKTRTALPTVKDRRADDSNVRKMKRNETDTWYGLHGACVTEPSPFDDDPLVDDCLRELFRAMFLFPL